MKTLLLASLLLISTTASANWYISLNGFVMSNFCRAGWLWLSMPYYAPAGTSCYIDINSNRYHGFLTQE